MDIIRILLSCFVLGILFVGIFLWIGFVVVISFMEVWFKFWVLGVFLLVGLGIGKFVFYVLNKVELVLMVVIILSFWKFWL